MAHVGKLFPIYQPFRLYAGDAPWPKFPAKRYHVFLTVFGGEDYTDIYNGEGYADPAAGTEGGSQVYYLAEMPEDEGTPVQLALFWDLDFFGDGRLAFWAQPIYDGAICTTAHHSDAIPDPWYHMQDNRDTPDFFGWPGLAPHGTYEVDVTAVPW